MVGLDVRTITDALFTELNGALLEHKALVFRGLASGARRALVNGAAGGVVFAGDRPYAVVAFRFGRSAITEIDFLIDPERLARLDLSAVANPAR